MVGSRDSEYGVYRGRLDTERNVASAGEEIFVVIVLMGIAAAIRYWKLGLWSFWADEIFTVRDAQNIPGQFTINPVIYIIVRFFLDTFGISEWSARLGPYIIGVFGVPVIYWSARRMFNAKVGIIASAFLVIHPWHIFWSQNARAYSLAFFLTGLSAFLFYLALERDSIGLTVFALFMTVLSMFSYLQTIMILPALVGYVILLMLLPVNIPRGLNEKNLLVFFGPFIIGLLLLISPSIRNVLYSGWGSNQFGRSPVYVLFTLVYCLGIPIAVAAFIGGIQSLINVNRSGLFLICYAIVPLLLLLFISPFLNVRGYYLFFTMPAYLILAAFCASELMGSTARGSRLLSAAVVLIILIASLSQSYLYFMVENGGRPKWREAFQTVKNRVERDDTVVISMPEIAEYYLREPDGRASPEKAPVLQLESVIAQLGMMENLWGERSQDIWFILDQLSLNALDSNRRFREWLYANCRLVEEFPVYARVMDRTISIWHIEYRKAEPLGPLGPIIDDAPDDAPNNIFTF